MKQPFRRFISNRRGAFAMQFALMAIPIIACTGVAIDGGRAFLARFELSSALDAAALAIGSTITEDADRLDALARRFVDINFSSAEPGAVALNLEPSDEVLILKGEVEVDTFFMGIMGIPHVTVAAESEVRRGGTNVEVALVLDTTGSMEGQRMTDLKAAAANLVDIVVTDDQTPYFSRLALVSYGDNVHAGDYADAVRGAPRQGVPITAADWKVGYPRTISGAAWKDGGTISISSVTRASQAQVTADRHGLSDGDAIYITSVRGMTQINNKGYRVADATTNSFRLRDISTNLYVRSSSWSAYTSRGTIQKCLQPNCEVEVTSAAHGFSTGDHVHISGVQGMTQINNDDDESWRITQISGTRYRLDNSWGPGMSNYTRQGEGVECITAACEVQVTADRHGLSHNDWVYITGARGMSINTSGSDAWQISRISDGTFILNGSVGPSYGGYAGSGTAWCLEEGCQYYRFRSAANRITIREISKCASERIGAYAYTDDPPTTAAVGRAYAGGGYTGCRSYGAFEPLTDSRADLKARITGLATDDSTAGHIGLAWGWYMLSPDWGYLWPDDKNRPQAYTTENVAKVLVLMTDGDFNTAYCDGVVSKNYGVGSSSDRIDCNATNGNPFDQADKLCAGIKGAGITIYTVGFGGDLSRGGGDFLADCASSPRHVYLAATGEELRTAFSAIARSISLLRLSR